MPFTEQEVSTITTLFQQECAERGWDFVESVEFSGRQWWTIKNPFDDDPGYLPWLNSRPEKATAESVKKCMDGLEARVAKENARVVAERAK